MKRVFALLLSATLLLSLLTACQQTVIESEPPSEEPSALVPSLNPSPSPSPALTALSCADIIAGIQEALGIGPENMTVYGTHENEQPDQLAVYLENAYGLAGDDWADASIARQTGASAVEMAVLHFVDEDAAKRGEASLQSYLQVRERDFTGYAPAQAELVADAALVREGLYLGLFIHEKSDEAGRIFTEIVRSGSIPEPAPSPETTPQPVQFKPTFGIGDLLHRILLEAACPNWRSDGELWKNGNASWLLEEIENTYGITPDQYQDCSIGEWGARNHYQAADSLYLIHSRYQVAIFQADSEEGAVELVQALEDYKSRCIELFRAKCEDQTWDGDGIDEEDLATMERAATVQEGYYAALIVSEHVEEAVELFPRAVNSTSTNGYFERYISGSQTVDPPDPNYPDRVLFTPPNEDDMSIYDTSAILAAWAQGDPTGLSDTDRAVYDAARKILDDALQDGMNDLEKETSIYRWIVRNVDYDWTYQDAMAETARTAYQPYGGLVDRTAVCLGYATSFQLLMDLAGVECITVVGACYNSEGDHAWNMVRLKGNWYCVDATWDANGWQQRGESYKWKYFNITSDEMAKNHQWDYVNTPEAITKGHGQG